jgi:hypothetical protein
MSTSLVISVPEVKRVAAAFAIADTASQPEMSIEFADAVI